MTDLAESLVEKGIGVTAIAGRGRYEGGGRLTTTEEYKGVRIERAWATSFGKGTLARRLADYLSFYIGATWTLLRQPRHDLVMALTTPPLIGLVALLVARLRRMCFVAVVQDLYPDIAVALGALRAESLMTRGLERLSRFMLRNADRVIVLSECMRKRVVAKIGSEREPRIDIIHNWADGETIKPLVDEENPFRVAHGFDDAFIVTFSGNWGLVNEFQTVLEAARMLRDRSDILFLFIGNGARANEIHSFCRAHDLPNVRLLPYQPQELLRYSLAAANVSLITLAPGLAGLSVPSKTYGLMAVGSPLLFVGDEASEIAQLISASGCGTTVASGQSERLAEIICRWSQDKAHLLELGERARRIFESHFDRPHAVSAYICALEKCLSPARRSNARYDAGDIIA